MAVSRHYDRQGIITRFFFVCRHWQYQEGQKKKVTCFEQKSVPNSDKRREWHGFCLSLSNSIIPSGLLSFQFVRKQKLAGEISAEPPLRLDKAKLHSQRSSELFDEDGVNAEEKQALDDAIYFLQSPSQHVEVRNVGLA